MMQQDADGPAAQLGGVPTHELLQWADERLGLAVIDGDTMMTSNVDSVIDENQKMLRSVRYGFAPLMKYGRGGETVIGAIVLGFHHGLPQMPEPEVLRAIGAHLADASHLS